MGSSRKSKAQLLEELESLRTRLVEPKPEEAKERPTGPRPDNQALDELAELEHLYGTAPVGLCLMDADLRFVRINERLAAINGRPVSEHIGRTLGEVIPDIAPKVEPIFRQVIETGEPCLNLGVHGSTLARPDEQRDWLASYRPLKSPDGTVVGVSAVVQDITDLKRTEQALRQAREQLEHRVRQRTTELKATNESLRGEIADRRRAEEMLRQSERDYRALFANAHDAILVFDPDDETILEVNDRACEVYGFQRAEMIGASLDIIQPKDRRGHARTREILERDTYQGFELVHYRKDQTELFVEVNAALVQYQGRPAILSINRDVTGRKRAERALRDSELRFRQIAENVGEAFFLSDARDNRVIYLSPAYEEIWGRPVEEVYADPRAWQEAVHPEDRQRISAVLEQHGRGQESFSNEYRIVRPDGAIRWVHDRVFPVRNEAGEVYRIVGVSEDITDRKRVEAELRDSERQSREQLAELELLYRTAPLGLCHMDTDLRYRRCNEKLAEINGIPAADHIGRTLREIVPEIAETMESVYRQVIESGEPVIDVEASGTTAADPETTRHFSACYYPVKAEDGVVRGVSSIVQEITERKRAEEDMRRLQNNLAHLGRVGTLGQMAAMLAHETNQPLAAIANYTEGCLDLLRSGEASPEELTEKLERAVELTHRTGRIVRGIRDLARKSEPHRSSVDLNELVREVATLVDFEARSLGVAVYLEPGEGMPMALVDRVQIQQVILNLVRNAFDAMADTEKGRCTLTIRTDRAGGANLEVTVSDTGRGLPADQPDTLFEPFFTTKPDGLGMGLAISRTIIDAHGGRIGAEPHQKPKRGTTFRFTLPCGPGGASG